MIELRFEPDEGKAEVNLATHAGSFEEAASVFYDEWALEFYDDESSEGEDDFVLLGLSARMRLLMACYCYRAGESVIRIISARKARENESRYFRR